MAKTKQSEAKKPFRPLTAMLDHHRGEQKKLEDMTREQLFDEMRAIRKDIYAARRANVAVCQAGRHNAFEAMEVCALEDKLKAAQKLMLDKVGQYLLEAVESGNTAWAQTLAREIRGLRG